MIKEIKNKIIRIQELRRSNAATAIPSKKNYSRKIKHKKKWKEKGRPVRACRTQPVDNLTYDVFKITEILWGKSHR
jgi:hypothetical protein